MMLSLVQVAFFVIAEVSFDLRPLHRAVVMFVACAVARQVYSRILSLHQIDSIMATAVLLLVSFQGSSRVDRPTQIATCLALIASDLFDFLIVDRGSSEWLFRQGTELYSYVGLAATALGIALLRRLVHRTSQIKEHKVRKYFSSGDNSNLRGTPAAVSDGTDLASEDSSVPKPRILIVDDVAINRLVAIAVLRKLGFECDEADTGESAFRRVTAERAGAFTLILMDLHMPVMVRCLFANCHQGAS
jgi:hypothetical protein